MTTPTRLADLRRRGVVLAADGDRLRFLAPKGALSPADREFLASSRAEILADLAAGGSALRATGRAGDGDDRPGLGDGRPGDFDAHNARNSPGRARVPNFTDITGRNRGPGRREISPLGEIDGPAGGQVVLGRRAYRYAPWDGEELDGDLLGIAARAAPVGDGEASGLTLALASDGSEHRLIPPDRLGEFLLVHRDRHLVLFDVGLEFRAVEGHLSGRGEDAALEAWRAMVDSDRMHGAMILDQLIGLARSDADPGPRGLSEVAYEYAGLRLDRPGPARLRHAEVVGEGRATSDRDLIDRAIKASIATLAAYRAMQSEAAGLMEAHGLDSAGLGRAHGLLGEAIQVKAAIALVDISRRGMALYRGRVEDFERIHRDRLARLADALRAMPGCGGLFKVDAGGRIRLTARGRTPSLNEGRLRQLLVARALRVAARTGLVPPDPRISMDKVSLSVDVWKAYAPFDPFIRGWLEMKRAAEACRFFGGNRSHPLRSDRWSRGLIPLGRDGLHEEFHHATPLRSATGDYR